MAKNSFVAKVTIKSPSNSSRCRSTVDQKKLEIILNIRKKAIYL